MDKKIMNEIMNGKHTKKSKPMYGDAMGVKNKLKPIFSDMIITKPYKGDALTNLSNLMQPMKKSTGNVGGLLINFKGKNPADIMGKPKVKTFGNLQGMMIKSKGNVTSMMIRPKSKKVKKDPMSGVMPYMYNTRKGNIAGDMITSKQRRYLKRNKGVKRFFDTDGDGVPDGMDCDFIDPNKHGFFKKTKNWATGGGFNEDAEARRQRIQRQALEEQRKEIERYEKLKGQTEKQKQRVGEATSAENTARKYNKQYFEDLEKEKMDVLKTMQAQGADMGTVANWATSDPAGRQRIEKEDASFGRIVNSPEVKKELRDVEERRGRFVESGVDWSDSMRRYNESRKAQEMQGRDALRSFENVAKVKSQMDRERELQSEAEQMQRSETQSKMKDVKEQQEITERLRKEKSPGLRQFPDYLKERAVKGGLYDYSPVGEKTEEIKYEIYGKQTSAKADGTPVYDTIQVKKGEKGPGGKFVKLDEITKKESTGETEYSKKFSLGGAVNRALGSPFSPKWKREMRSEAEAQDAYKYGRKNISTNKLKDIQNNPLLSDEEKKERITFEGKLAAKEQAKKERREKEIKPIMRLQDKQQTEYAKYQIALSKFNMANLAKQREQQENIRALDTVRNFGGVKNLIGSWGYDGDPNAALSQGQYKDRRYMYYDTPGYYNVGSFVENQANIQEPYWPKHQMDNSWIGADGVRSPDERILPKNRLNGDVEGTLKRVMRKPQIDQNKIFKQQFKTKEAFERQRLYGLNNPIASFQSSITDQPVGYVPPSPNRPYDPEAPKFVYRRDINSFTRKTNRVKPGEELEVNKESQPSTNKRSSSLYPWTKPMQGWKRVYVGKGRYVGKGAPKRGKSYKKNPGYDLKEKAKKPKFVPFKRTYEQKELERKG